jgi:hypothetical protein
MGHGPAAFEVAHRENLATGRENATLWIAEHLFVERLDREVALQPRAIQSRKVRANSGRYRMISMAA